VETWHKHVISMDLHVYDCDVLFSSCAMMEIERCDLQDVKVHKDSLVTTLTALTL